MKNKKLTNFLGAFVLTLVGIFGFKVIKKILYPTVVIDATKGTSEQTKQLADWNYWIELSDTNYKLLMQGKILKISDEGYALGVGILQEQALPALLRRALKEKQEPQYIDGKIIVRFALDLTHGEKMLSGLTDTAVKKNLEPYFNKIETIFHRMELDSNEFVFADNPQNVQIFDQLWNNAKPVQ